MSNFPEKASMNKTLVFFFLLFSALLGTARTGLGQTSPTQTDPEMAIRKVMADQAEAWSRGSIDDFMKGYWNSDSLVFVGQSGLTYGYQQTLANYKKHYDTQQKMGKLFFTLLSVKQLSPDYCLVLGKWLLKRQQAGDIGGLYSLLFRKIDGHWRIIVDHTS
jgi:ketosteroid isomerase-like protein